MKAPANRSRAMEDEGGFIDILRETVIEYYGQMTWVMLEKHIRNRDINEDSMEELLEVVKEFFGGSEEVITLIFSRYSGIRVDANELSLEN